LKPVPIAELEPNPIAEPTENIPKKNYLFIKEPILMELLQS
jgi:hypothetical protein